MRFVQFLFFKHALEPKRNLVFEPLQQVDVMKQRYVKNDNKLGIDRKTVRSMIHPQYANRFIRQYLIDESEVV